MSIYNLYNFIYKDMSFKRVCGVQGEARKHDALRRGRALQLKEFEHFHDQKPSKWMYWTNAFEHFDVLK